MLSQVTSLQIRDDFVPFRVPWLPSRPLDLSGPFHSLVELSIFHNKLWNFCKTVLKRSYSSFERIYFFKRYQNNGITALEPFGKIGLDVA